jgi:acetylornithine deacetylase/succinyl-diaminopimelate desuccinylase-like protein
MTAPKDVIDLLQSLVRIPSVNPHGDPGTTETGEARCAAFVGDFLKQCGARVELREVRQGRMLSPFSRRTDPEKTASFLRRTPTPSALRA